MTYALPEIWHILKNVYVGSEGFAKCSPERLLGIWPLIHSAPASQ